MNFSHLQKPVTLIFSQQYLIWKELPQLDCPSLKGNHVPHPKFERPNGKNTKSNFFFNRSRIGAWSTLETSMKQIL